MWNKEEFFFWWREFWSAAPILTPHRHIHQEPCEENAPPSSDQNRTVRPTESTVGPQMVRHCHCQLCERMIAFAAIKGIFFSGSFCAIFWLKKMA